MSVKGMKQAIEALNEAVAFREGGRQKAIDAINVLRTAIQQAEAKTDEPVAWISKTGHGTYFRQSITPELASLEHGGHKMWRPLVYGDTHPAPGVPEFYRIAKRKLDELQEQGFAITGYAIQRGPVRGFIDGSGFVGWWQCEPDPGVPDDVVRDAERYRWLRSLEHCNEAWCLIGSGNANSNLDAAIDAAMLAASPAQKGGE